MRLLDYPERDTLDGTEFLYAAKYGVGNSYRITPETIARFVEANIQFPTIPAGSFTALEVAALKALVSGA